MGIQHVENAHLYIRSSFSVTCSLNLPQSVWTSESAGVRLPRISFLTSLKVIVGHKRQVCTDFKRLNLAKDILSLHSEGQGKSTRCCCRHNSGTYLLVPFVSLWQSKNTSSIFGFHRIFFQLSLLLGCTWV